MRALLSRDREREQRSKGSLDINPALHSLQLQIKQLVEECDIDMNVRPIHTENQLPLERSVALLELEYGTTHHLL